MARLDPTGVSRILTYIKTWITGLLNGKANSSHTHNKSQITDFPTIPTNTNQLTNGAGFITSSGSCNYANSAGSSNIAIRDSGGLWISGRDNAVVKQTRHSTADGGSWNPAVSVKTKSGNWTIGTVGYDKLQFSYDTDEDYNTGNNRNTVVELNPESGTIITSANIGSQSVNYANSSGNADTLDGSHAWQMQTLAANGGVHGSNSWLMQCQHNVDGDGYFKLYCGDKSVGTKVDRASSAGYADSAGWANGAGWANSAGGVARGNDNSEIVLNGGTNWTSGASLALRGQNESRYPGSFDLHTYKYGVGDVGFVGSPNGSLYWGGQPVQYSSDQRLKQQISNIDDKLLDAWEDVSLVQYKYNDAVGRKGDNARLHTGYVVQQIDEACKSHNLDISAYGLYCHEEYSERTEEVEVKQDDGSVIKETKVIEPAKEQYSLRYTEALIVECAYLRREVKRLSERLEKLEK